MHAWAPRGERARCSVARNRGKNTTTLLVSTTSEGMGPFVAVVGSTTAAVFEAYVERVLAQVLLRPGQVVVMDNLGAHKGERVRCLIEVRGCELLFLAPYSPPDLDSIEDAFSKVKALLRRAGARTHETLVEAIGRALDAVSTKDARGFFEHYGYLFPAQPL